MWTRVDAKRSPPMGVQIQRVVSASAALLDALRTVRQGLLRFCAASRFRSITESLQARSTLHSAHIYTLPSQRLCSISLKTSF